mgnify:CR=1 FL=1
MSEMEQSMRKLSMAQLAISSLYVDSVDEVKLTEDAINGSSPNWTRTPLIPTPRRPRK